MKDKNTSVTSRSLRVLATDLDGTLIPLPEYPQNKEDLLALTDALEASGREIVFATGRHYESVLDAISTYALPEPEWMVCDVGSSIMRKAHSGYQLFSLYEDHLKCGVGQVGRDEVVRLFLGYTELEPQPEACQRPYKVSYFCQVAEVDTLAHTLNEALTERHLPYRCMGSIDPFENVGLLDIMPQGVSKASALLWLATHADFSPQEVVFSGDSGNDYAALVSGFHSILVGNASEELRTKVKKVMEQKYRSHFLYCAENPATSGVREGCIHYGLIG